MSRNFQNFISGTVSDNPLTVGATTLNSAGLAALAAIVAPVTAMIVLDPQAVNGAPEIVIVTAHTGAATSATITRGALGTVARQHNSGETWVHSALADDMMSATLLAAKGTLLTASGAGVPVGLAVGTDGQVVTADAASPGGLKYATPAVGLLDIKQYAAGADGPYTMTNDNTLRALDTTNLTVSPVIPASGKVIVRQQIVVNNTDTTQNRLYIGIRVHGSSTQVGLVILLDGSGRSGGSTLATFNVSQYITGLTPGAATWDFAYISNIASTALWKGTGVSGGVAPTLMEVWAA